MCIQHEPDDLFILTWKTRPGITCCNVLQIRHAFLSRRILPILSVISCLVGNKRIVSQNYSLNFMTIDIIGHLSSTNITLYMYNYCVGGKLLHYRFKIPRPHVIIIMYELKAQPEVVRRPPYD